MRTITDRIKLIWERIGRERHLKRNLLVVTTLVVLGLGTIGYIFSQQQTIQWPWHDEFRFSATFDEAPAVNPESRQEVRIAGVSVGDIQSASVDDEGNAKVEMSIDSGHAIYENARVVLRPKSPLNEMYVALDPGGPPAERLAAGSTLPITSSSRPIQVDEALGHLDANARDALTTLLSESDVALANAPSRLPGGLDATGEVLKDLRPVVAALQSRQRALARLVNALGRISTAVGDNDQRLSSLASSLQRTLRTTGERSGDLDVALAELPEFTAELKHAMSSVSELSSELDPTLDNLRGATDKLPGSLAQFTKTIDQVGKTVDAARPVVAKAKPVVRDLRPFIGDVRASLVDVKEITRRFEPITSAVLPYLTDLKAFVVNTRSVVSLRDKDGSAYRAAAQLSDETISGLVPLLPELAAAASR